MATFRDIDGATYVDDAYWLKAMGAERRNGLIAGIIVGFIAGIAVAMLAHS